MSTYKCFDSKSVNSGKEENWAAYSTLLSHHDALAEALCPFGALGTQHLLGRTLEYLF